MSGVMMHGDLPRPTWSNVLFATPPHPTWLIVCAVAALAYVAAVYRLHRRGDRWPLSRTVLWLSGLATIYLVAGNGFARYAMVLFSAHMAQHMMLNMYTPILLVLGAPVTLALRALPAAGRGAAVRRTLVRILHSRVLAFLSSMPVAIFLFLVSLFGLYFTPLFSLLMSSEWGHVGMQVHFLITGYLFFWTIIGPDPGPRRPPPLARLVVILPVGAMHALFAVTVAFTHHIFGEPFISAVQPAWSSLRGDQALGGGIAGGLAELPMGSVAVVCFLQWFNPAEAKNPSPIDLPVSERIAPIATE
ncbi:MAG: cytochrome c oxidase assembly protein [Nocardioidaceae bacterium]